MKLSYFLLIALGILISGCCTDSLGSVESVIRHQDGKACQYGGYEATEIQYLLDHGHTEFELISYLEKCKDLVAHAKYKRGQKLRVKSNSLCIFQVYYPAAKYMELSTEVYYVGQENCNGLIDTHVTYWQHELRKL